MSLWIAVKVSLAIALFVCVAVQDHKDMKRNQADHSANTHDYIFKNYADYRT